MTRLGDFVTIVGGGTPDRSVPEFWDGDIPWATIKDLNEKKYLTSTQENVSSLGVAKSATNIVQPGTVIAATRIGLGKVTISTAEVAINQDLKALYCKPSLVPHYLYYFLRKSAPAIQAMGKGATVKGITLDDLKGLPIRLPTVGIQQQIANALDKADTLRHKDQELLRKYDELTQSIFYKMFGNPMQNEKCWPVRTLDQCVKGKYGIKAGPFGSALKKEYYVTEGYKIYGQEQVIADDFEIGDYFITAAKYKDLESCKIESGDVLISMVGTYGKVSVVPSVFKPGIINPRLVKLSFDRNVIYPLFFKFLFQLPETKKMLANFSRGGTMDIINAGILKQLSIPVPPITEQEVFLRKLEKVSAAKLLLSETPSSTLFQALMTTHFA